MNKPIRHSRWFAIGAGVALSLASALPAFAETTPKEAAVDRADASYEMRKEISDQKFKQDKRDCKRLSGNDKDVCMKEAKANHEGKKAEAKADMKSDKAHAGAADERRELDFAAEMERCDALSGDAKNACASETRLKFHK